MPMEELRNNVNYRTNMSNAIGLFLPICQTFCLKQKDTILEKLI